MVQAEGGFVYDMRCQKPITITKGLSKREYPDGLAVPCGKCLLCRIAKRKEWSLRMMHELDNHQDSSFVTLTYDEENLPLNSSLIVADLQKYFKRLRKNLNDRKIKYFACGEYGERLNRPHYHAIIFGLHPYKDQDIINDSWAKGLVYIGVAEPDSINYTAQYIDKKYSGDLAVEHYDNQGREPVFKICSLGIGKQYAIEHEEEIVRELKLHHKGSDYSLPRYYVKLLNPDRERLKENAIHQDCLQSESIIGVYGQFDDIYKSGNAQDVRSLVNGISGRRMLSGRNAEARIALKAKKL